MDNDSNPIQNQLNIIMEILEESKENDSPILLKNEENKKSKFKNCLNLCLFLPKKASKIVPNSSIKLPLNFRGESSYSNWIMKIISSAILILV